MAIQSKNPIMPGFYPDPSICAVGEDYYLLPSSINEFLIIPANECFDRDYLKSMVTDINRTVVDATLYLSDSIYYYDHEDDKITKVL